MRVAVRTTIGNPFTRKHLELATAVGVALLLATMPGFAEAPLAETTLLQQNNVRRLVLTNECAGCNLADVSLIEAHLIGADLRNANLVGVDFTGANLEGADLMGADLTGANFTGAFLTDTSLANTQLIDVNFTEAHLYNTDVRGATMENLNLAGADVFNTHISIGGESLPDDATPDGELPPLEPMIPFEETQPLVPNPEYLLDPIL